MMWWPGSGWGWGGWLTMTLVMVAFWALGAWIVMTLVRQVSGRHRMSPTPQDVLAERFARGEIDEDEYRKRRDVLRGDTPRPVRRRDGGGAG